MKELKILSTKSTPEIILKPDGIIKIRGCSMNVNRTNYFKQIVDWIDKYVCDPADLTCVDIRLERVNVSNLKIYISLLKKIELIILKNKKYVINWYYEEGDEDILEMGEDISFFLNMPFNLIKVNNVRSLQD